MTRTVKTADPYKAIKYWRSIALREKNNNDSKREKRLSKPQMYIMVNITRPFFSRIDMNDSKYIRTYRMIIYGMLNYSKSLKTITLRASGYNLGKHLAKRGLIRSIDDLPQVFINQRIGLLDIVDESFNNMKIHIYECMSCYGIPNIGMPMCDFEAGVIQGALDSLIGKNITKEKYCWGLGYSFCGFEVYFE